MTSAIESAADRTQVETLLGKTISDIGIPPCPDILNKISVEMAKDEPNLKYLDSIISSDVGLSAGLIALANSPFFGFRNRVRSVREALQMLGLNAAGQAVAGLILRKLFPPTPALLRFWDSSARIAHLSGWLAQGQRVGLRLRADEAYTFGLFRDCGIPVLLKRFPQYPDILKQANADMDGHFTAIEDSLCQTNHAAVGGLLAQAWWLPDDISLAIRHHHDFELLAKDKAKPLSTTATGLICIAHLAEHLYQTHTGLSHTQEWNKVADICLGLLGIDAEQLAVLYEESPPVITT